MKTFLRKDISMCICVFDKAHVVKCALKERRNKRRKGGKKTTCRQKDCKVTVTWLSVNDRTLGDTFCFCTFLYFSTFKIK